MDEFIELVRRQPVYGIIFIQLTAAVILLLFKVLKVDVEVRCDKCRNKTKKSLCKEVGWDYGGFIDYKCLKCLEQEKWDKLADSSYKSPFQKVSPYRRECNAKFRKRQES